MWLVLVGLHFSFQDWTNQFFPNFLWFQFKLSSQKKITINKKLLTNKTVLHFALFLEQTLLRAEAMLLLLVQRKSQASSLIGCITNERKIREDSITEWFNGECFLNIWRKVVYNTITDKYDSFWFLYLHSLDYFSFVLHF